MNSMVVYAVLSILLQSFGLTTCQPSGESRLARLRLEPVGPVEVKATSVQLEYLVRPSKKPVDYAIKCVLAGDTCNDLVVAQVDGTIPVEKDKAHLMVVGIDGLLPNTAYTCFTETTTVDKVRLCQSPVDFTTPRAAGELSEPITTVGISPTSWTAQWIPQVLGNRDSAEENGYAAQCVPKGASDPSKYPVVPADLGSTSVTVGYLQPLQSYDCVITKTTVASMLMSSPIPVKTPGLDPQCVGVDEEGNPRPVDWFVMIKQPAGWDFVYVDNIMLETCSNSTDCWYYPQSINNMETGSSPVAFTLQYAYDARANGHGYIYYNDQPPYYNDYFKSWSSGSCSNNAHAKTALAFSENSGFLLDHSSPAFPLPLGEVTDEFPFYWLGSLQACLAQQFGCFNFDQQALNGDISQVVYNMKAWVYDTYFPASLQTIYPTLYDATKEDLSDTFTAYYGDVSTIGGQDLKTVSRPMCYSSQYNSSQCEFGILQDNFTTPYLEETMHWMSFISVYNLSEPVFPSQAPLPGACPANASTPAANSLNILNVTFPGREDTMNTYGFDRDHAKWGVSDEDSTVKYACVGDMNRAGKIPYEGQPRRGGAFYCLQNDKFWELLSEAVTEVEPCGAGPPLAQTNFAQCPVDTGALRETLVKESESDVSSGSNCKRYYTPA
mmetsp:Transcript_13390/g.26690  ORF Transcript_13390/g.26690 Transcript_13390/m.26690 type:complete len:665 (+) Transcript_13390:126-2120(+)